MLRIGHVTIIMLDKEKFMEVQEKCFSEQNIAKHSRNTYMYFWKVAILPDSIWQILQEVHEASTKYALKNQKQPAQGKKKGKKKGEEGPDPSPAKPARKEVGITAELQVSFT